MCGLVKNALDVSIGQIFWHELRLKLKSQARSSTEPEKLSPWPGSGRSGFDRAMESRPTKHTRHNNFKFTNNFDFGHYPGFERIERNITNET